MGPRRHTSRKLQRKLKRKIRTEEHEETGLPVACALPMSCAHFTKINADGVPKIVSLIFGLRRI